MILNVILVVCLIIAMVVIREHILNRIDSLENSLLENINLKLSNLLERTKNQETKLQGSYAMSEALCRRISILSQDIDGQTKLLSGMAGILIPKNERDAFFKALDEYDTIIKDLMKKPQSPPPPTADENDSPPQGSNNSDTDS